MRDRFGIFGTVTRFRELSLLLVMMLRIPNNNRNQRRQIIKDGWADYEGEVVTSEDIQLE